MKCISCLEVHVIFAMICGMPKSKIPQKPPWTFLTNHGHVVLSLAHNPDILVRELAVRVGITERAVQRILCELADAGYITREKTGRRTRYTIDRKRALRHPVEAAHSIGDLIGLVVE